MIDFKRKKQKGGKMDPKWLGPLYIISQDLGKGLCMVKSLENTDVQIKQINLQYGTTSFSFTR